MLNQITLIGRLTADPKQIETKSDRPMAAFTLAVNRDFKQEGQPEADFFDVVAFGQSAKFATDYFKKGIQVCVSGRIQLTEWQDKEQVSHRGVNVVAENVYIADGKKE